MFDPNPRAGMSTIQLWITPGEAQYLARVSRDSLSRDFVRAALRFLRTYLIALGRLPQSRAQLPSSTLDKLPPCGPLDYFLPDVTPTRKDRYVLALSLTRSERSELLRMAQACGYRGGTGPTIRLALHCYLHSLDQED